MTLTRTIIRKLQNLFSRNADYIEDIYNLILQEQMENARRHHPNPLNRRGAKCFSQTDEDGITLEILRRLEMDSDGGAFAEFGVGNGLENNTLALVALGWSGFWVSGQALKFMPGGGDRFHFQRRWVTRENVLDCVQRGCDAIGRAELDVISMDLDGNDIYLLETILEAGITPKLFIVEYNAKFPPPIRFRIAYNDEHHWKRDDYFGASLAEFNELLAGNGYRLICCNSHSGANAFFVSSTFSSRFDDVPDDICDLYEPPRYHLFSKFGHTPSVQTVTEVFNRLEKR